MEQSLCILDTISSHLPIYASPYCLLHMHGGMSEGSTPVSTLGNKQVKIHKPFEHRWSTSGG